MSSLAYRPEIDGLRALAVGSVILCHAGAPGFSGGFIGVDVFFTISGFLITTIIADELAGGRFTILRFYERRARRILPALVVVVLACVPPAIWLMLPWQLKDFGQSVAASALFSSNILFWREAGYFTASAALKPLLHTWSLAIEEQFYLLLPPLMMALPRRAWLPVIGALTLISLMLCEIGSRVAPGATYYLLPMRGWELGVGAMLGLWMRKRPLQPRADLGWLGLALILVPIPLLSESVRFPSLLALAPVGGAALVLAHVRAGIGAGRLLAHPLAVGLGLISYSAYLWHQPLFAFARLAGDTPPALMAALVLATLVLTMLSWRWIETPFRHRDRVATAPLWRISGAGLAGMAAIGMALVISDGMVRHIAPADRAMALMNPVDQGRWLQARFIAAQGTAFDDPNRPNLLIIGDSFGEDLVNMLAASGRLDGLDLSTHHISARCGNLWTDAPLRPLIAPGDRAMCARQPRYERAELQTRIATADMVILASSWRDWQVAFLPETVARLRAATEARLVVLGRKDFGTVDLRALMAASPQARPALRATTRPDHLAVVAKMREIPLPGATYVDLHRILCGPGSTCPLFTSGGDLISHDGAHLTEAGAKWAGARLVPLLNLPEGAQQRAAIDLPRPPP